MIITKELTKIEDFENLKKGDWVACEFHRDIHEYPKQYRFNIFQIVEVKESEIILTKKTNIYFNFKMFLAWESNLKNIISIENQIKNEI